MKRIFLAVMRCTLGQPKKIIAVGIRVRDILYANVLLYATPPVTLLAFSAQLATLEAAQAAADEGGKVGEERQQRQWRQNSFHFDE
mgnify:CR=1 FL=1